MLGHSEIVEPGFISFTVIILIYYFFFEIGEFGFNCFGYVFEKFKKIRKKKKEGKRKKNWPEPISAAQAHC